MQNIFIRSSSQTTYLGAAASSEDILFIILPERNLNVSKEVGDIFY